MGARGPAPKPTALRVLHGDKANRINREEPKPSDGEVKPPEWLEPDGVGHRLFLELAPDVQRNAGLCWWDNSLFGMFCQAVEDFANAKDATERLKLYGHARQLGREFGLTPSARSGIRVGESKDKNSAKRLLG